MTSVSDTETRLSELRAQFENMSPFARWGSLFVLGVLVWIAYQAIAGRVETARAEVQALAERRAALQRVATAPDVSDAVLELDKEIAQLETLFLRGATDGINGAQLQERIVADLSGCGLTNLTISVDAQPPEPSSLHGAVVATVRGRDSDRRLADCLAALHVAKPAMQVTGLNWLPSSLVQFEIRALTLAPTDVPTGTALNGRPSR